jgi:hypothetical protein
MAAAVAEVTVNRSFSPLAQTNIPIPFNTHKAIVLPNQNGV